VACEPCGSLVGLALSLLASFAWPSGVSTQVPIFTLTEAFYQTAFYEHCSYEHCSGGPRTSLVIPGMERFGFLVANQLGVPNC
jgi:hypothetical protein